MECNKSNEGFLLQTSIDYCMDIDEVKKFYRWAKDGNEFYELLEQKIKERQHI